MNVRLLRKVAKHIAEEPKRLSMGVIVEAVNPHREDSPSCGTVGCIAGWACLLSDVSAAEASWHVGESLLKLHFSEAFRLFDYPSGGADDGWPKKFVRSYHKARTAKGRADVTIARIEHFIKTKGQE